MINRLIAKRGLTVSILVFLFIGLTVLYNNCTGEVQFKEGKLQGTVTGNPMASNEILFAICSVLDRCQAQVPFSVCMSGVPSVNGVGSRLGLAPNVYNPYSSLENAESTGVISADLLATNTCVDTINNLSCTDPNVVNAYNSSSSSPFAAVPYMVPMNACGQVFTPPVQSYACSTKIFLRGVLNTPNGPAISGTGLTYSITPTLPAGLSLDPNTGIISGTPTSVSSMTPYTVTASGPSGSSSGVVSIRTADGYLVNDLSDSHNVGPGCVSTTGKCTLRAAVEEVNSVPSPSVILLPSGGNVLSLGPISITQPMDIYGDCAQGTTIDGNDTQQIFSITAGDTSFNSITVQNGFGNNAGGAGFNIQNSGSPSFTVKMNNVTVQNNIITGPGPGTTNGAGIYISGNSLAHQAVLNLSNCTFLNNQDNATNAPFGGAINFQNNFTQGLITNCTFTQNSSEYGGAIMYSGNSLSITDSLFYNNKSTGAGEGGAISDEASATGNIILTNDTFDSNTAFVGGAISAGTINYNLTNCTFANNSASNAGGGGAVQINGGGASVSNSVFLGNLANGALDTCSNNLASQGNNLSDDVVSDCNFSHAGDIVSTSAQLGLLQGNGGSPQTMALLPASAGIRQGNPATCPSVDQRNYPRHVPTSCDIGAFESQ